ncbi:MAG: GlsB/YeaQ/YmgE family stress response membrane protein [Kordiimonas sp.]
MIWTLIIGAIVGFLAGHILRGEGYGAIGNIILGIFGGLVGGFLFGIIGLGPTGLIGEIISGTVGAVILVYFFGNKRHGGKSDD